jgi:hypothetical protein
MGYHRLGIIARLQALAIWLYLRREHRRLDRADRAAERHHVDPPEPPAWVNDGRLDERDVELWCAQICAADTDRILREATR